MPAPEPQLEASLAEILADVAAGSHDAAVDPSRLRRVAVAVRGDDLVAREQVRAPALGPLQPLVLPDGGDAGEHDVARSRRRLGPAQERGAARKRDAPRGVCGLGAPDQYEAEIPGDLGPCDLVAAGGVAARAVTRHAAIGDPTRLEPLGLLADADGRRVNLADWALPLPEGSRPDVPTVAVVGTAMNAGKTTTAGGLIRGLASKGLRVGAAKVTGTGAGGDTWLFRDAGADPVLDFTDAGLASTYLAPIEAIEDGLTLLHRQLAGAGVDAIVLEVADGILQRETAELVVRRRFRELVDGVLFAAGDAPGAIAGVAWLRERGIPLVGVSGLFSASPLAMREAQAVGAPIHDLASLGAGELAAALGGKTVARAA